MATVTSNAESHKPRGDPDHIAYGRDYFWRCSCGKEATRITRKSQAKSAAERHEEYCPKNGTAEVDVV